MAEVTSTKPYMVRAIHEWCLDNNFTPHLLVAVNAQCRVPMAFVKNGEIVLNLNYSATKDLHIDNDAIVFSARFSGVAQHLYVPMSAIKGIFARENSQGLFFDPAAESQLAQLETTSDARAEQQSAEDHRKPLKKAKPTLTIVK